MHELGFTNILHVSAIGFSGGLVKMWREDEIAQVEPIAITNQEIHANVHISPSAQPWILSLVYDSTSFNNRKILLHNLEHFSASHKSLWILSDDFNEIASVADKFCGDPINNNRANAFLTCMHNVNMLDLRFTGSRFT